MILQKIFMLFDSVNIFKKIWKNWINLKNYKKSFSFSLLSPAATIKPKLLQASFAKLEHTYTEMDCFHYFGKRCICVHKKKKKTAMCNSQNSYYEADL